MCKNIFGKTSYHVARPYMLLIWSINNNIQGFFCKKQRDPGTPLWPCLFTKLQRGVAIN